MRGPEGHPAGTVCVSILLVKQGDSKEVKGTLVFDHASYLYPFARAKSLRRPFNYVKLLKADFTRSTHSDQPKVHTPGGASKIRVAFSWKDY